MRDAKTITLQEAKARVVLAGDRTALTTRFVIVHNDAQELEKTSLQRARRLVGPKGYVINIAIVLMRPAEVIDSYDDFWRVDRAAGFRNPTSPLAPSSPGTRDAIEARLTIVFTALAVNRDVRTGPGCHCGGSCALKPLRTATIDINGVIATYPPALNFEVESAPQALQPASSNRQGK